MCKVSIVVPIYNVEHYLSECLESLVHQSLKDIEIICINDGSKDNSKHIVENYVEQDNRVKLINQNNSGLGAARNRGIEEAEGEYIYFCDSDDFLAKDAMEQCYKMAQMDNLDVLRFGYFDFDDGEINRNLIERDCFNIGQVFSGPKLLEILAEQYNPSIPILFIKKKYLDKYQYRFIEGIIHEDHSFFIEVMMTAQRTGHLDKPLYYRRNRFGSIMQTLRPLLSAEGMILSIRKLCIGDKFCFLDDEEKLIYDKYLAMLFRIFLNNYVHLGSKERKKLKQEVKELYVILKRNQYFYCNEARAFYHGRNVYLFYRRMKAFTNYFR